MSVGELVKVPNGGGLSPIISTQLSQPMGGPEKLLPPCERCRGTRLTPVYFYADPGQRRTKIGSRS